jgi:hypothetical protein
MLNLRPILSLLLSDLLSTGILLATRFVGDDVPLEDDEDEMMAAAVVFVVVRRRTSMVLPPTIDIRLPLRRSPMRARDREGLKLGKV